MIEVFSGIEIGQGITLGQVNVPGFIIEFISEDNNFLVSENNDYFIEE